MDTVSSSTNALQDVASANNLLIDLHRTTALSRGRGDKHGKIISLAR